VKEERAKRRIEAILASMPALAPNRRIVVLCYHSVHPSKEIRSTTPRVFEQQIEWLLEHCEIVPFSSIPKLITPSADGRPLVAVTFDDGYEDNHRYAFPILLAHGVRATIFVTTGLVDQDPGVMRRFARSWRVSEDQVQGLSWSQISEMRATGFDIGAHTRSHPILSGLRAVEAREEIKSSKDAIEEHLGEPVPLFAYPFGKPREHLSNRTIDIVAELGFESAATILYRGVRQDEEPLSIPRFPITRDSMEIFSGKIQGRLDAIGRWQTYAPRWLSGLISTGGSQPRTSLSQMPDDIPSSPAGTQQTLGPVPDPGPDWVFLPWSRSPRWFLPREPPRHARAGLSVYYPVTLRSRIGWESARALAGQGAFRFLRGFSLMPREVWEAAGPLIPSGGGLAVARANHPGRFLALVFDVDGRPTAFVKVARDTLGSLALSREREAIEGPGARVPPPLIAPKLLMHSEGVLVVDAIDWRPRASPWRLPEEVAFALGGFFRNTSSDAAGTSGAAHGDFAPWNLLQGENGWGVVDWESFHTGAPPYFDLFHYMIQSRSELRRPLIRTILEGLKGKGWVGAAIGAYAAGSEVDAGDSAHFLREYLRISAASLDPDGPRRGVRVRSRISEELGS
jgi:peptidoglycan/xylan/chitin deacetylase (PgdA/CDA1 family)